jgi:1,4-alpha-glucan branching enzyme
MIWIEHDGTVSFGVRLPGAKSVELVGAFDGWHEQRIPMEPDDDGNWRISLQLCAGEHLYRYLIDGCYWILDAVAHGTRTTADGTEMSRVWVPPTAMSSDSRAA